MTFSLGVTRPSAALLVAFFPCLPRSLRQGSSASRKFNHTACQLGDSPVVPRPSNRKVPMFLGQFQRDCSSSTPMWRRYHRIRQLGHPGDSSYTAGSLTARWEARLTLGPWIGFPFPPHHRCSPVCRSRRRPLVLSLPLHSPGDHLRRLR